MTATQSRIHKRIEQRLRRFVDAAAVGSVCEAILQGQVIHLNWEKKSGVVAFRRGVLFVAGREYIIGEE